MDVQSIVMPTKAGIYVLPSFAPQKAWMAGPSPAITMNARQPT
jgi:hypothetical protein